jgi:hypothetical protein
MHVVPKLAAIHSGPLVDYPAGELIDNRTWILSRSVGCTEHFRTAQYRTIDFSDTTGA